MTNAIFRETGVYERIALLLRMYLALIAGALSPLGHIIIWLCLSCAIT